MIDKQLYRWRVTENFGKKKTFSFTCEKLQIYLQRTDSDMRKAIAVHLQWRIESKRVTITRIWRPSFVTHAY